MTVSCLVAVVLLGGHLDEVWSRILAQPPERAVADLRVLVESHPQAAAAALWTIARLELDHRADPVSAAEALDRLVQRHPEARDAERARRQLEWLRARPSEAVAARLAAREEEDLRGYTMAFPGAGDLPVVTLHLVAVAPADQAHALLLPHREDERWGWLVRRESARRHLLAGNYIRAWRDYGEVGASGMQRYLLWRLARAWGPLVLAVLVALGGWRVVRRLRASRRA